MKATIYHNPMCGTSRKTLEILNNEGADVTVIEYLKAPPSREELKRLYERAGITPREGLRAKEPLADELGLTDPSVSDDRDSRRDDGTSDPHPASSGRNRKGRAPVPPAGGGAPDCCEREAWIPGCCSGAMPPAFSRWPTAAMPAIFSGSSRATGRSFRSTVSTCRARWPSGSGRDGSPSPATGPSTRCCWPAPTATRPGSIR